MTCLIIGGNAAGMSAAARLKRKQPDMQVMVLERTDEVSYGACGMPYYIAGFNDVLDRMRIRKPQAFRNRGLSYIATPWQRKLIWKSSALYGWIKWVNKMSSITTNWF